MRPRAAPYEVGVRRATDGAVVWLVAGWQQWRMRMSMSMKSVVGWCVSVLLSLLFLAVGAAKFRSPAWAVMFAAWGYPAWTRPAVGGVEIVGALLLLIPRTRRWAAVALMTVMAGAAVTHLLHGEASRVAGNVLLAGLLALIMRTGDRSRAKDA